MRIRIATLTVAAATTATGCSSMNNTEKGTLVGGGVGAVVGTAIGAATGNPRTGAAVGALGGAAIGGLAGNSEDKKERADERAALQQAAASQNAQLGLMDVVTMSRQGTDADVIVAQIRNTRSTFTLSTADIQYCTEQAVSPKVIRAMQDSRVVVAAAPRPIIVREAPPPAVIIERPYYGPPPMVGVGFYGRRW